MSRVDKALEYHHKGCNCAQAVVLAFADKYDINAEEAFKATEALGFGGGDSYGTCGAVSGMAVALGLINSSGHIEKPDSKADTYKKIKELNAQFRQKNGSTICRDIKGIDTGKVLRSCDGCIEDATRILAAFLEE